MTLIAIITILCCHLSLIKRQIIGGIASSAGPIKAHDTGTTNFTTEAVPGGRQKHTTVRNGCQSCR